MDYNGFLIINKESGWTSRDVCNKVQSIFHTRKVGHIGTLDPFATGLLIVTVNKGTKAGQFLESSNKTYLATLVLGESRDGGDVTGEVLAKKDIPPLNENTILEVFHSFIGEVEQVPPLKSAVHFEGRKLYQYAYNGEVVTPPSRKVSIYSLDLVSFTSNTITFRCEVSKGTYIRVLGEDIAKKLGTLGYLSSLHREKISSLTLEGAKLVKDITVEDIQPIYKVMVNMKQIKVDDVLTSKAKRGLTIYFKGIKDDNLLLLDQDNNAIAVYTRKEGDLYKSLRGLF